MSASSSFDSARSSRGDIPLQRFGADDNEVQDNGPPAAKRVKTSETEFRGRTVTKEVTTTELSTAQRVGWGVAGVFATLAALPLSAAACVATLSLDPGKKMLKTTGKWLLERGIEGEKKSDPKYTARQEDYSDKPFDPTSKDSIREYLRRPEVKERLRDANGHTYLVVPELGGFIFCPNQVLLSDPQFIKAWTARDGKTIYEGTKLHRVCRAYCTAYNHLQTEVGRLAGDQGIANPRLNTLVFHLGQRMVTTHAPSYPSDKKMSWSKGVSLNLSNDVWDEIETFWNKTKTNEKMDLGGDKSFSKARRKRKAAEIDAHSRAQSPSLSDDGDLDVDDK